MQAICSSLTNKRYIMESLIYDNKAFMEKNSIEARKVVEENNKQNKQYCRCQSHIFFTDNYLRLVSKIQEQPQPNLIKYFDYFKISDQSGNTKFYAISEYYDESNSLQQIMRNNMTQDLKQQACEDVANGLDQILKFRYQHRSIQPCNIYFIDNTFKIGNFVESIYIVSVRLTDAVGNQLYWSQELKQQAEKDVYEYDYDHTIDIFALACLMFEIFAQKTLFEKISDRTKIPQQQLEYLQQIPQYEKQFIEAVITEGKEKRQKQFITYLENVKRRQSKGQIANDQFNSTFGPQQIQQQNILPNQSMQKQTQNQPSIQFTSLTQQSQQAEKKPQFTNFGIQPQQPQNNPIFNPPQDQNDLLQKTYTPNKQTNFIPNNQVQQSNFNNSEPKNQQNFQFTANKTTQNQNSQLNQPSYQNNQGFQFQNSFRPCLNQIQESKYLQKEHMQQFEKYKKDKPEEKDLQLQISQFIIDQVREELIANKY